MSTYGDDQYEEHADHRPNRSRLAYASS
jgi:hypothetical protein